MLYHHAYELEGAVFDQLRAELERAVERGSFADCIFTFDTAAWRRQLKARDTRRTLDQPAREQLEERLSRVPASAAGAFDSPVPVEHLQGLERALERFERCRELRAPEFLVRDIREHIERLLELITRDPTPRTPDPEDIFEPDEEPGAIIEKLSFSLVHISSVIGVDEIGLREQYSSLSIAADFREKYPHEPVLIAGQPLAIDAAPVTIARGQALAAWYTAHAFDQRFVPFVHHAGLAADRGNLIASWLSEDD